MTRLHHDVFHHSQPITLDLRNLVLFRLLQPLHVGREGIAQPDDGVEVAHIEGDSLVLGQRQRAADAVADLPPVERLLGPRCCYFPSQVPALLVRQERRRAVAPLASQVLDEDPPNLFAQMLVELGHANGDVNA